LTQEQLARLVDRSTAWLGTIETGHGFPHKKDIIEIEKALRLAPKVFLDLLELNKYEEPNPVVGFRRYLDAERRARVVRQYSALVVPELLQVPEYARALITARHPMATPEAVESLLGERLRRQEVLSGDAPPRLWLIVDEAALRRPVGGRAVHLAQLDALSEAAQRPNVGLQLIPASTGAHAGLMGGFTILGFADDPDIAYTEDNERGHFRERPDLVRSWFNAFEALRTATLPATASSDLIRSIREKS
jgi:transcriptional regulator with XRE-family HTH domain